MAYHEQPAAGPPRLSVIIPSHNRKDMLLRTIRGFEAQRCGRSLFEVIVVDDGSNDSTAEALADFRMRGPAFRYLRQEQAGPAAARNLGTKQARGQIILFTGDDCIPHPDLVSRHLGAHDREGDVAVLGHIAWHPELRITPFLNYLNRGPQFNFSAIKDKRDAGPWYFYTANISLRRQRLEAASGFDEDFEHAAFEDLELGYRLAKAGLRVVYEPKAVTYHHHETDLARFMVRQRILGRAAVLFWRKHPELKRQLGLHHVITPHVIRRFFDVVAYYCYLLGVRDALRGAEGKPQEGISALWQNEELTRAGVSWAQEVFATEAHVPPEVRRLQTEYEHLLAEYEAVTSRRLYKWADWLAARLWAWGTRLGLPHARRRAY